MGDHLLYLLLSKKMNSLMYFQNVLTSLGYINSWWFLHSVAPVCRQVSLFVPVGYQVYSLMPVGHQLVRVPCCAVTLLGPKELTSRIALP